MDVKPGQNFKEINQLSKIPYSVKTNPAIPKLLYIQQSAIDIGISKIEPKVMKDALIVTALRGGLSVTGQLSYKFNSKVCVLDIQSYNNTKQEDIISNDEINIKVLKDAYRRYKANLPEGTKPKIVIFDDIYATGATLAHIFNLATESINKDEIADITWNVLSIFSLSKYCSIEYKSDEFELTTQPFNATFIKGDIEIIFIRGTIIPQSDAFVSFNFSDLETLSIINWIVFPWDWYNMGETFFNQSENLENGFSIFNKYNPDLTVKIDRQAKGNTLGATGDINIQDPVWMTSGYIIS